MERASLHALKPRTLRSVAIKLAAATLAIIIAATAIVSVYVSRSERERVLTDKERGSVAMTGLFAQDVQASVAFGDTKGVEELVAHFASEPSVVYTTVFGLDLTGTLAPLATNARDKVDATFDVSPEHGLAGGVQRDADQLLVDTPVVTPAGKAIGFTRVVFSLDDENALIQRAERRTLAAALVLGLGLSIALIALTRVLIVRRLSALARAARRLQDGEENVVVDVKGDDEVGALAEAFRSMSRAIESREREISRRNRDLRRVLDNVDEGFLTVDLQGRMSPERSRILDTWFGPATTTDFFEYVSGKAPVAAHALKNGWRDIAEDFMPLEVILDQLPGRVDLDGRAFALQYRPVLDGDTLVGIVVTIRDMTATIQHEAAERAQREAMAIFRRLVDDPTGFERFIAEGNRLLASLRDGSGGRSGLLRDLHTLKGNAGVYELETVARTCHELEDRLADEGGETLAAEAFARLEEAWARAEKLVTELGGGRSKITVTPEEHASLVAAIRAGASAAELERRVLELATEPAERTLARLAQQARALGRRLGKGDLDVVVSVSPPGLRVDDAAWKPIWLALPHLVRNALDHGIEASEDRVAAGKPAAGELRLSLTAHVDGTTLAIGDDGAGIDWAKLREVAARRGLPVATEADLVAALFAEEVTTRSGASETSGRGVGTSAVRAAVLAAGGDVRLTSERGHGTTFFIDVPARGADLEARRAA